MRRLVWSPILGWFQGVVNVSQLSIDLYPLDLPYTSPLQHILFFAARPQVQHFGLVPQWRIPISSIRLAYSGNLQFQGADSVTTGGQKSSLVNILVSQGLRSVERLSEALGSHHHNSNSSRETPE